MSQVIAEDESPVQTPLFISAKEAAPLLTLSRSRVYELMDDGTIPSVRLGPKGGKRMIPVAAFQDLLRRLQEG